MRPVAIVSAAAYVLAVIAGVALHSHVHVHLGHIHAHTHPAGGAGCSHHGCDHRHGGDVDRSGGRKGTVPGPHHHHDGEDCPVCEFLAQTPVPHVPVELPAPRELVKPPPVLALASPVRFPFSGWQGRAPPAMRG